MSVATRSYWLLAGILVVAFGLRLLANVMFESLRDGPNPRFGVDGVEFNAIAGNLVQAREYSVTTGHPTSFRAPGFPFALASIYAVAGVNNFLAARLFFCLTGAATCLAVYLLAREVTNEQMAVVSAALVACYPNILYYTIHFSSEPLFTLLLTLSTWLCIRGWRRCSSADYALSGLALGLAALTRPVAFYFGPLFVAAVLYIGRRRLPSAFANASVFVLALMLPIVPWAVRNYCVHDRWLPFSSNGGSTFWGSNNDIVLNDPQHQGQWVSTERLGEQKDDVKTLYNEVDRDRSEWAHGKQFVREHLSDVPRLTSYKLRELWTPICKTPNHIFNLIIGLSYGAAIPFMLGGFWLFVRDSGRAQGEFIILLAPIVGTVLSCFVFYGSARFRSTIEPLLLIFAALALTQLLESIISSGAVRIRPRTGNSPQTA